MNANVYYRLLNRANHGQIVKGEGRNNFEFDADKQEWVRSGIMLDYFWPESDTFEMYEEISEEEAMKSIERVKIDE